MERVQKADGSLLLLWRVYSITMVRVTFCKIDFIILEEMTHFRNVLNNWGNLIFISNLIPTITSRGETDTKFRSEIYTQCTVIGEAMDFMPLTANRCNISHVEGIITEQPIQTYLLRT